MCFSPNCALHHGWWKGEKEKRISTFKMLRFSYHWWCMSSCNGPLNRSPVPERPRKFLVHRIITSPHSTRTRPSESEPASLPEWRPLPFVCQDEGSQGKSQTTTFVQIRDSFVANLEISNTGMCTQRTSLYGFLRRPLIPIEIFLISVRRFRSTLCQAPSRSR